MKIERAREIASLLNDPEKRHSHSRAIDAKTLREEVNLKIDSFKDDVELHKAVRNHFELLGDYMHQRGDFSPSSTQGNTSIMNKKPAAVDLRKNQVLERNKNIDTEVVRTQAELERELKGLGVEIKPEFKVDPPP